MDTIDNPPEKCSRCCISHQKLWDDPGGQCVPWMDGDKNCVSSQVQLHLGPPQQQIMSPCQCNMLCVWTFKSFLQSLTVVLGGVYSQNE